MRFDDVKVGIKVEAETGDPTISLALVGADAVLTRCMEYAERIEDMLFSPRSMGCTDPRNGPLENPSILTESIVINDKSQRLEEILARINKGL